ncbi:MAG: amidohydrolase family protein [Planctomycetota bacterium]|jgi:imidazolonepropionase-like amidohydrolase
MATHISSRAPILLATALLAGIQLGVPAAAQDRDLLVKATRVMVAPDNVTTNSAILIRNGKVRFVGAEIPQDAAKRATVVEFSGMLVPGLVNAHSNLGHGANLVEKIDAFTPELVASDAFDPFVDELLEAAQAGVTTVGLSPQSLNTFAGQAAMVQTGKIGKVVAESAYLKMSFTKQAYDQNRYPTSRMGAAELIRTSFKEATGPLGATNAKLKILSEVVAGSRKVAFHASTQDEISAALDLAQELSLQPILVGAEEADKSLDRLAALNAAVVLSPLSFTSKKKRLTLPAKLQKRGIPFAFMAERQPDLRLSAALAVHHGTSRTAAMSALTEGAAKMLGIGGQVGNLFQGKTANFCVFSGDPTDLTSRLVAVYVAGEPIQLKKETPQ